MKTPLFAFNSKFDAWQSSRILQLPCYAGYPGNHTARPCTAAEQAAEEAYGTDFLRQLGAVEASPQNGAFITTCLCHRCPWFSLRTSDSDPLTAIQHYARWAAGKTVGTGSVHIDWRGVNAAKVPSGSCWPFP